MITKAQFVPKTTVQQPSQQAIETMGHLKTHRSASRLQVVRNSRIKRSRRMETRTADSSLKCNSGMAQV
jgi:hypothetical protein